MATISVAVGNGSYIFSPNNIKANIGDTVEFDFFPKDHSVAQASFSDPCHPLPGGFYSNYVATSTSPSNKTFSIVINDTNPIWFYCTQHLGNHCQTGEVGVINGPDTGNTLDQFAALAKNATNSTSPLPPNTGAVGGVLAIKVASNGTSTSTTLSTNRTSTPTILPTSASTTPTSTPEQSASNNAPMASLNYSILAVAIILFVICVLGVVGFWLYRNQARQSSGTIKSKERVDHGNLENKPWGPASVIELPELSQGMHLAELPTHTASVHNQVQSRDNACQNDQEVHALSFL